MSWAGRVKQICSRRRAPVFRNGVTITSVQMSKGLEFDEVLIPQADDRTYSSRYDRSLLYIACTRAMHRLTLTYTGRITPLAVRK